MKLHLSFPNHPIFRKRSTDVPDYGLLNDLLWSDPSDIAADWEENERGG